MNRSERIRSLVLTAAGAALIAVCSWITIPTTVPFTMQTFAIFFLLMLLGGMRALAAVCIYLLIGAAGVPVFSRFTSGIGVLFGNTGGYMLGFLFICLLFMLAEKLPGKHLWVRIAAMLTGLAVCYAFGTLWFWYLYTKNTESVGIWTVLGWCVFPFVIPDLVKMGLAVLLARRVAPALSASRTASSS